jgi:hypothetical protein
MRVEFFDADQAIAISIDVIEDSGASGFQFLNRNGKLRVLPCGQQYGAGHQSQATC